MSEPSRNLDAEQLWQASNKRCRKYHCTCNVDMAIVLDELIATREERDAARKELAEARANNDQLRKKLYDAQRERDDD